MKLNQVKKEILDVQYMEDTSIIDVCLATLVSNRLRLGNPIWMVIIGKSSGGKSQILKPLALSDPKFMHQVDDLTENTFLSSMNVKGGQDFSLLNKIGPTGMIVISDLTVIFSKNSDSKNAILSQLRMIYDGEMTKMSGNKSEPTKWKGKLGIIAGSTPSVYAHFEDVADMGERFVYFRMKEYDERKATHLALSRGLYGRELDEKLATLYGDYVMEAGQAYIADGSPTITIPEDAVSRIIDVSMFAERIRTTAHKDFKGEKIIKIPCPAAPMRVAQQLFAVLKGLAVIQFHETGKYIIREKDIECVEWCGWSLANEEKRAVLKIFAEEDYLYPFKTSTVADKIGLDTSTTGIILQNLAAVGVLNRTGSDSTLSWSINHKEDWEIVRRINNIAYTLGLEQREETDEEQGIEEINF